MAEKLVQRVRSVVGAENDDFFRTETIVDYLNKAQNKVVSYLIQNEVNKGQTLRALDKLRTIHTQNLTGLTPETYGGYQYIDVAPNLSGYTVKEILYVSFVDNSVSKTIRTKELTSKKLFLLDWGNIVPSTYETYYYVTGQGTTLRVFASNIEIADSVKITLIKNPNTLNDDSETVSIAQQYTNAVIYGAAIMLGVQEQRGNVTDMMELYKKELETNIF